MTRVLKDLARLQREAGPALDRIGDLEISRHHFEAEMRGVLLNAEGKLRAANNSEARERQLKKSYEKLVDQFDPDGEEAAPASGDAVLAHDVDASEAERVQALRLGLAPNNKAHAQRAKWGT